MPTTVRVLCAGVLAGALLTSCSERPSPPCFIVVSLDTTRADHLGAYGHFRDTTPVLDGLAARGLLFEQAITVSENTLISHASIFTGLVPAAHGATHVGEGSGLSPGARTVAEDFRDNGYQTAGFVAHGDWLNAGYGMDRGFESFTTAYRDAGSVLGEALEWLGKRDRSRPFFLFVHLFDVHSDRGPRPYEAPEGFRSRFTGGEPLPSWADRPLGGSAYLSAVSLGEQTVDAAQLEQLRIQYDQGLAATDDILGSFFAQLDAEARAHSYILVTADHGEEFLEHGRMLHSSFYDEVVRVPLLMAPPEGATMEAARLGPPRRIKDQVRVIDIRPTLLELAGLPTAARSQGVSLVPWLAGERSENPAGPATVYHQALRQEGFKFLRTPQGRRLFDLRADPGELHNLAELPEHKQRADAMHTELNALRMRAQELGELLGSSEAMAGRAEDDAMNARLRALGYTK
jgi:arylsulfatase A-like enzyme